MSVDLFSVFNVKSESPVEFCVIKLTTSSFKVVEIYPKFFKMNKIISVWSEDFHEFLFHPSPYTMARVQSGLLSYHVEPIVKFVVFLVVDFFTMVKETSLECIKIVMNFGKIMEI